MPSVLLIHGAASGAWIWSAWRRNLAALGWQAIVIDLRGHGRSIPIDLSAVTLEDYVSDVASVTVQIEAAQGVHPVIMGWDMGGMVAMMYAATHPETPGLVLLEPPRPLEAGGKEPMETVRKFSGDVISPERFGLFADDPAASRASLFDLTESEAAALLEAIDGAEESGLAYRQGLRGVPLKADAIECPSLVLYGAGAGREDIAAQQQALAAYLGGESLAVPGAGHWGIVAHEDSVMEAARHTDAWLRRVLEPAPGAVE